MKSIWIKDKVLLHKKSNTKKNIVKKPLMGQMDFTLFLWDLGKTNKTLFLIKDLSGKKKYFLLQKLETWPQFRPDAFRDQTLLIITAFYMKFQQ